MTSIYDVCVNEFRTALRVFDPDEWDEWDDEDRPDRATYDSIVEKCKQMEAETRPHIGRLLTLWDWVSMEWAISEMSPPGVVTTWNQGSWIMTPAEIALEYNVNVCGSAYCCAGWGLHTLGLTDKEIDWLGHYDDTLLAAIADAYLGVTEDESGMYSGSNEIRDIKEYVEQYTGLALPDPDAEALYEKAMLRRQPLIAGV